MLVKVCREVGYWFVFSVVIALAQLWLIAGIYYVEAKTWTWVDLLGNGSLLFFATTITSKTALDYLRKETAHNDFATILCILVTAINVLMSVAVYSVVAASRLGMSVSSSLPPIRIAKMSEVLTISGLVFSLFYTLYIRLPE